MKPTGKLIWPSLGVASTQCAKKHLCGKQSVIVTSSYEVLMNVPFLSFEWIIFHFNGLFSIVLNLIISLVTDMAITKHFKNNLIFLKKLL